MADPTLPRVDVPVYYLLTRVPREVVVAQAKATSHARYAVVGEDARRVEDLGDLRSRDGWEYKVVGVVIDVWRRPSGRLEPEAPAVRKTDR